MTRRGLMLFWLTLLASLAPSTGLELCSDIPNPRQWCVEWEVVNETLYFNVTAQTTGWVAIGFSEDNRMRNTDVVMCWVGENNTGMVTDRFNVAYSAPPEDTQQDVTLHAAWEADGTTFCAMSRLLTTNDTAGDLPINVNGSSFVLYAMRSNDPVGTPAQHQYYGVLEVAWVPPPPTGAFCGAGGRLCVEYYLDAEARTLRFVVTADTAGWAAFGITTGGMYPADPMLCWVDADGAHVFDGWNSAHAAPSRDAQQDLTGVTGSEVAGVTTCSFTRALDTGDAEDAVFYDGEVTVAWAVADTDPTGDPDSPSLAAHVAKGVVTHTFFTGVNPVPPPSPPPAPPPPPALEPPPPPPSPPPPPFTPPINDCPEGVCPEGLWCESPARALCVAFQVTYDECRFEVTADAAGWASFGFTRVAGKMFPADVYVAVDGTVVDAFNIEYAAPEEDVFDDVLSPTSSVVDGKIIASFRRKLDTMDSRDVPFSNSDVNVVWALHGSTSGGGVAALPKHTARGTGTVNLFAGGTQIEEPSDVEEVSAAAGPARSMAVLCACLLSGVLMYF